MKGLVTYMKDFIFQDGVVLLNRGYTIIFLNHNCGDWTIAGKTGDGDVSQNNRSPREGAVGSTKLVLMVVEGRR